MTTRYTTRTREGRSVSVSVPVETSNNDINETLEHLVDEYGLEWVLDSLSAICHDKAEHLSGNWQDDKSAKAWARCASVVNTAATRKVVASTSPARM